MAAEIGCSTLCTASAAGQCTEAEISPVTLYHGQNQPWYTVPKPPVNWDDLLPDLPHDADVNVISEATPGQKCS